ncbi:MAG: thaumatin family protein [Polyangiaceae bacterium]
MTSERVFGHHTATLAELTLAADGPDFYDVSAINGVNVPVSMAPIGGTADPSNPYTCATPGAVTPSAGLAACSWTFDPSIALGSSGATDESTVLRAVAPGGATCTGDGDCTVGAVCGTALTFGSTTAAQTCGAQIAWWTADELCAYTGNVAAASIACNQSVSGQGTAANLYGCDGANATSCYGTSASTTCCGCPDWAVDGGTVPVAPGFSCNATNPEWQSIAEPWAAFAKDACPTAYSFPFDDATSTFTCAIPDASAATPNAMGYAITFCPGGRTAF